MAAPLSGFDSSQPGEYFGSLSVTISSYFSILHQARSIAYISSLNVGGRYHRVWNPIHRAWNPIIEHPRSYLDLVFICELWWNAEWELAADVVISTCTRSDFRLARYWLMRKNRMILLELRLYYYYYWCLRQGLVIYLFGISIRVAITMAYLDIVSLIVSCRYRIVDRLQRQKGK